MSGTQYYANDTRGMYGPLSIANFAYDEQRGTSAVSAEYTIKAFGGSTMSVLPVPTIADQEIEFYYISTDGILPKLWSPGIDVNIGDKVTSNGRLYIASDTGITGSNQPVHTSGTADDGGVDWDVFTGVYGGIQKDTDITFLPEHVFVRGIMWRLMRLVGNDYQDFKREYDSELSEAYCSMVGSSTFAVGGASGVSWWYPLTGQV